MNFIDHVIVLMLENRSFDHMVGYMRELYPPGTFDGLDGTESNPDTHGRRVTVSSDATGSLPVGPDHSHVGVMSQLFGKSTPGPHDPITNEGFVRSYEGTTHGNGSRIMQCFAPPRIPVLAALAKGFAICDHWFCSVPGETWPNRNYCHAATSDGEVNIRKRFYTNRTVFQVLRDAKHEWAVYHQGPAQLWVFPRLWQKPFSRVKRFRPLKELAADIRAGNLPAYTFVEPDHGLLWPKHRSNSQHPSNNLESPRDFYAGEQLIVDIYAALFDTPNVFNRTLFIVTYDEHGGFYDHAQPPRQTPPAIPPDKETKKFAFNVLGPRVPTVLVSPWIPADTVDHAHFDHSAIPASLRSRFAPNSGPLSARDAASAKVWHNLSLEKPRAGTDMPDPRGLAKALEKASRDQTGDAPAADVRAGEQAPRLDEFQNSLIDLAVEVDQAITQTPPGQDAIIIREDFENPDLRTFAARAMDPATRAAYLENMEQRFRSGR